MGNAGYQNEYGASHWGMYGGHNCTNYTAYRLIARGIDASYLRGQGMAYQWGPVARSHGVSVDGNPRVGDIAWFSESSGIGSTGHVAYVESVNPGAGTVRVSEDSYGSDFDWRDYLISSVSGFIHFGGNPAPANQAPAGVVDSASAQPGTVTVAGWAFDRDVATTPIEVHVYVGGPPGSSSGEGHSIGIANGSRPDVASAYPGVGANHGFNATFVTGKRGRQPVYVFAIDQPSGDNPLIGQAEVVIGDPNPVGSFDQVLSPAPGKVRLRGWTFDPNAPKQAVHLHAYLGGPAGQGEFHDLGTTGVARPDVQAAYPETGGSQGFDATFSTSRTGFQTVYVYALNLSGTPGDNVLLGSRSTTINALPIPRVDGELAVGSVVTAQTGSWPKGTVLSYQWFREGTRIAGANGLTYRLIAADAGKKMSLRVTGNVPGAGSQEVSSAPSLRVLKVDTPRYNGDVAVGRTLVGQPLDWTPGTTFTYQWLLDGVAILGATNRTYTTRPSDEGRRLGLVVTGSLPGYARITRIASTDFRVLRVGKPTISGTARVGMTIQADPGAWSAGSSFIYKWLRDGATIGEGPKPTYTIAKADLGKRLSVQVIGWNTDTATLGSTSEQTDPIKAPLEWITMPTPKIVGAAKAGSTLTAKPGTWSPAATLSYQWLRDGKAISGATKSTYKIATADRGHKVSVKVTASKSGYLTTVKTSATVSVANVFSKAPVPKISGKVKAGVTVKVSVGTWSPAPKFSYQWLRDGKAIAKATASSYKVSAADRRHALSVRVTATKSGYETASRTSGATRVP
ncbi:MAG: CHAP domain-containing protein [Acidipropionibacterium sp.]|jgi:surface antigen|nr:CHAP domain-containing protein [Acidipropionibacterium sp.]